MTKIVENVIDCKTNKVIKLIKQIRTSDTENIYLIDKEILFKLHQWNVVKNIVITRGDCEIEFYEYSPFIFNNLVRKYKFKRVLFIETTNPEKFVIKVEFDKVELILELDVDSVCPVYSPPKRGRSRRRKKN